MSTQAFTQGNSQDNLADQILHPVSTDQSEILNMGMLGSHVC